MMVIGDGYVFDVRHVVLGRHGVGQLALLSWNTGQSRMPLWVPPSLRVAIKDGDYVKLSGHLNSREIVAEVLEVDPPSEV